MSAYRPNYETFTPGMPTTIPRAHPDGTRLANSARVRAANLICTVRDEGADSIGHILDKCDRQALYALCVVLAAMVPDDVPASELLAWLEPRLSVVA